MLDRDESRAVLEVTAGFVLDQIRLGRRLLDFVDALLLLAVTQANVDGIQRNPARQAAFATYDAPPPDALRRPVSMHALALSLNLSFETVRRRVTRFTRLGVLRSVPLGVYAPTAGMFAPGHRAVLEGAHGRLVALHGLLQAWPEFRALPRPGAAWVGPPPIRASARMSGEYLLRLIEGLTALAGDPVDAGIWLEVFRSTSRDERGASQAVRATHVAKQMGLPSETVRRRIAQLVAIGVCEYAPDGVTIPPSVFDAEPFLILAEKNRAGLRRLYTNLGKLEAPQGEASGGAAEAA